MPTLLTMTRKPDKDEPPQTKPAPSPPAPKPRRALLGFRDRERGSDDTGAGGPGYKRFH